MYERFYNLRERPFALSPDPDYLYPSRVHQEALNYLRFSIETNAGFVVITGDIGSGKTTLLQTVLRDLDRRTSVARLVNTMLDGRDLIEAVLLDFGLEPAPGQSKPMLLRDLARFLVEQRTAGRLALLAIDEAQNLSLAALEEVRMLSNLETEKSKLIQIALIGQPTLRDVLARPDLAQLKQRVTVSYHLTPLDATETAAYINHRLRHAAMGTPIQFPRPVTDLIHQHSQGLPRKINVIADAVLLFGYGEDQRAIDVDLTYQVLEELQSTGVIAVPAAPATPRTSGAPVPEPAPSPSEARLTPEKSAVSPMTPAATATADQRPQRNSSSASEVAAQEAALAERETLLAARERRLAEQQQILHEGYHLLRLSRETARASQVDGSTRPTWLPGGADSTAAPPGGTSAPIERHPAGRRSERDRLWARLLGWFGVKPVFED
jgi:putative secretion ATPase (PEP-CTERM system associated)